MKIIWIDGTFGCGKTAVANSVAKRLPNTYLIEFDELQYEYEPNSIIDLLGKRYPEAKRYLVDALVNEVQIMFQKENYDFIVVPIAMINDYCNEKLANGFKDIESVHFILTASEEVLYQRIIGQENRDRDLALTYMSDAINYLENHYSEAIRIDTSDMDIDGVAEKVVEILM